MRLADIEAGRMMDWMLAAFRANKDRQFEVSFHVVGQGYELQAEGVDHLFIEPRRTDPEIEFLDEKKTEDPPSA